MADNTIDTLSLEIKSDARNAEAGLQRLAAALLGIGKAAGRSESGMMKFAQQIQNISASIRSLDSSRIVEMANSISGMAGLNVDQSINRMISSMARLGNATASGGEIATNIRNMGSAINEAVGNIGRAGGIDRSINQLVSSMARLASAGEKIKITTATLPNFAEELKKTMESIKGISEVPDSVNMLVQSLSRLASAGAKTGQAAEGMQRLTVEVQQFFQAMSNAPQISENTLRMTESLSQLATAGRNVSGATRSATVSLSGVSNAAGKMADAMKRALGKAYSVISKMFHGIGQAAIKAAGTIKSAAAGIASAFFKIGSSSSGIQKATLSLGSLLKAVAGLKAFKGLFSWGKSAIEFGSDITEVENVVDVAFGGMAKMAYDFASTAREQFGLSELAAKQYTGTMMAMLKSSGLAQKEAANMSVKLAGLAGDLASFYNIDTDTAFEKIRAGIAGQVMPLRQLGISMTVANLEAYALSQGIAKSYKEMSQAEKTLLRYNYLLAATTDQQGDFSRTAGTWANQVRLLSLNFQSLSAVVGQGLISALLPAVKLLNKLMDSLMKAATAFRNFMYTITGTKLEGSTKGVVNEFAGLDDAAEGLEDLGDAGEEAGKKLKKHLFTLPFDELNIFSDDSGISDFLKDVGNTELGLGDAFDALNNLGEKDTETPINKWAQKIRDAFLVEDWHGVGKAIAEMLNAGLQKVYDVINWDNVGPKIEKFVDAFTTAFNALVYHLDWDLLGRVVGAGINTLANTFNLLTEKINFELIGQKLSVGLRGMIDEIDWRNLGNALGNYFMISWRMFEGFVDDMWRKNDLTKLTGWAELGIALAQGVYGLFEKIDFGRIGTTLANGFNGIFEIIRNFNEQMAAEGTWSMIAENISNGLNNAIKGIKPVEAAQALGRFVTDLLGTMLEVAEKTPWHELGTKVGKFLANIPWSKIIGQVFGIISNVFGGFFGGLTVEIISHFGEIGKAMANGFNSAFERLRKVIDEIPWRSIADNIYTGLNNMIHGINWAEAGATLSYFAMKLFGVFREAAENTDWKGLGEGIGQFLSAIEWGEILGRVFDGIKSVVLGLIDGLNETSVGRIVLGVGAMVAGFEGLSNILPIVDSLFGDNGKILTLFKSVFGEEGKLVSLLTMLFGDKGKLVLIVGGGIAILGAALAVGGKDLVDACFSFMSGLLDSLIEAVHNADWAQVWHNIVSGLGAIISNSMEIIGKLFELAAELVGHLVAGLLEYVVSPEFWKDLLEFGVNLIAGLVKGVMFAINGLVDIVKAIYDGIVNGLKKWFGIHSPSTVMAELGGFIMQGLIDGLKALVNPVIDIFVSIKDMAVAVLEGLPGFFKDLWEDIKEKAKLKLDELKETISEKLGGVVDKVKGFCADIGGSFVDAFDTAKTKVKGAFDEITTAVGDFAKGAYEKIKTVPDNLYNAMKETPKKMLEAGKNIVDGVKKGIEERAPKAYAAIKTVATQLPNIVSNVLGINSPSKVFAELGGYTMEGLAKGTEDGENDVLNTMKDVAGNIMQPFLSSMEDSLGKMKDIMEKLYQAMRDMAGRMQEAGKYMMSGVTKGINENAQSAYNAVSEVANNITNSFRNKLGIHSPSKVFEQLADYTMLGFIKGAESGAKDVVNRMMKMADDILRPFNSIEDEFGMLGSGMANTLSDAFNGNLELKLPELGEPIWEDEIFSQEVQLKRQNEMARRFDQRDFARDIQSMQFRPDERSNELLMQQNSLLSELLQATKEGRNVSVRIDGREIVNAYDTTKKGMGWSFT